MIIAIHQPDFFPWLGVFDKINRADIFVYLDHVVNNPRDSLWTKRVQIILNGRPYWLTIPLVRSKENIFLPINKMRVSDQLNKAKHLRAISQSYGKAPYFKDIFPLIERFYEDDEPLISKRNIYFINAVCERLGIATKKLISSDFDFKEKANELLIEIIKTFDGSSYLHGKGAFNYQKNDRFKEEKIKLIYQNFHHPVYPQFNTHKFVPGLSILDPLMNIGFSGVRKILGIDINSPNESFEK